MTCKTICPSKSLCWIWFDFIQLYSSTLYFFCRRVVTYSWDSSAHRFSRIHSSQTNWSRYDTIIFCIGKDFRNIGKRFVEYKLTIRFYFVRFCDSEEHWWNLINKIMLSAPPLFFPTLCITFPLFSSLLFFTYYVPSFYFFTDLGKNPPSDLIVVLGGRGKEGIPYKISVMKGADGNGLSVGIESLNGQGTVSTLTEEVEATKRKISISYSNQNTISIYF